MKRGGYGVNIHDTKISYVQENSMQRNSALIAVLSLIGEMNKFVIFSLIHNILTKTKIML